MQRAHATLFLQSLRGQQSLVLWAFVLIKSFMTIDELRTSTGIADDDTIRAACKGLEAKDWLFKDRGAHGLVTWHLRMDTLFAFLPDLIQNPGIPDSGATTTTLNKRVEVYSGSSSSKAIQSPEKPDSGLQSPEKPDSGLLAANLAACKASGIGQPKASYLAALEHVTPDYIHAHVESEGPGNLGLAIRKIENNEQPIIWQRASEQPQQAGLWAEYLEMDESPKSICTWQDYLGTYKDNWGQLQKRFSRFCGESIPAGERYCTKHKKATDD